MAIPNNPCQGCAERFRACADNCPKDARGEYGHKAWKADLHRIKAAEKEYKMRCREDWLRGDLKSESQKKVISKQRELVNASPKK